MTSHFIRSNGIRLHYLDYEGGEPTLILMHGLTANAYAFEGLIAAGLSPAFRVISIDLRGRGLSDQPQAYGLADHAADIVGLLDALQVEKAVIGGHSFGALLTLQLAKQIPERCEKLILLDGAARMHENTKEMLGPALARLGQVYPSYEHYLQKVKSAPYLDTWEDSMLAFYKADIALAPDGTVKCIPQPEYMAQAVNGVLGAPVMEYIRSVEQPALLINGSGIYTMGAPLLPKEYAMETASLMQNCQYAEVPGNHQTMLYGEGARATVNAIKEFLYK